MTMRPDTKERIRRKYRACLELEELYVYKLSKIRREKKMYKYEINKWDKEEQYW